MLKTMRSDKPGIDFLCGNNWLGKRLSRAEDLAWGLHLQFTTNPVLSFV